jgi:hypothetical protein
MMRRRLAVGAIAAVMCVSSTIPAALAAPSAALAAVPGADIMVWDDFQNGFDYSSPQARWLVPSAGALPAGDGIPTTSTAGLKVTASGTNPATGLPAFVYTVPQEGSGGQSGVGDHAKWAALAMAFSSNGFLGFDAPPGRTLTCETRMSAQTFGTRQHPFGADVQDPDGDLRLASAAMLTVDTETGTAFDFFLTNNRVFILYERLTSSRAAGGNNAAFAYAVPVATRHPGQSHRLAVSLDRSAGSVRWLVDGRVVFQVNRIGYRLPSRHYLITDFGGTDQLVQPRQLACGMALFTFLDGDGPTNRGLVRLTNEQSYYFDPDLGEPAPQQFVDEQSRPESRLWGQGAQLKMANLTVTTCPA